MDGLQASTRWRQNNPVNDRIKIKFILNFMRFDNNFSAMLTMKINFKS